MFGKPTASTGIVNRLSDRHERLNRAIARYDETKERAKDKWYSPLDVMIVPIDGLRKVRRQILRDRSFAEAVDYYNQHDGMLPGTDHVANRILHAVVEQGLGVLDPRDTAMDMGEQRVDSTGDGDTA